MAERSKLLVDYEEKPESEFDSILDKLDMDISTKVAAASVFPSIVGILSRNVPDDMAVYYKHSKPLKLSSCPKKNMAEFYRRSKPMKLSKAEIEDRGGELVFWGCGIIIECEEDLVSHKYFSTIMCPATLFVRTHDIKPSEVKVDVYLWDGNICNGQVVAWDFHYNLSAIRIDSDFLLPTATLRGLDDVVPILPAELLHLRRETFSQLLPWSNFFKVSPGTKIITLGRSFRLRNAHLVGCGVFWTTSPVFESDCDELYFVKGGNLPERTGGAVINYSGEVIGLMFYNSPFLPINIVSSWWKHFKSCRQYRHPWIGIKIANLHTSCFSFLKEFMRKFPNVTIGVVVTEVAPVCSEMRPKDVIVKCDGVLVGSTLKFFDIIWNKVGGAVEVTVLRASDGETKQLSLAVKETPPDKFYQWRRNFWKIISRDE